MSKKRVLRKLYAVVFMTGAIVMILEMIGSRILAPNLGTSTYVWASIIGVILGAMSAGYYYGGKVADRGPDWKTLSLIIHASGASVFSIIITKGDVLAMSDFLGIKAGSVLASTLLFAVPSFLMGMVSPYAVRLAMKNVETSGRTVGNLYAVSTFGSIAGTFAAGFILIPRYGSVNVLFGLAFALFAIGFLCWRGKRVEQLMAIILLVVMTGFSASAQARQGGKYLVEKDSEYSHIRVYDTVKDNQAIRVMAVENSYDSGMALDGDELVFDYSKYYALDRLFGGEMNKVAIFGGAAYSVPKDFLRRNSTGTMDAVEIDPETTAIAREYFRLQDDPRLNIIHNDARIFINQSYKNGKRGAYDAIYNDAFSSACSIPAHLTTREALRKIYDLLDEDGVYIINVISSISGDKSTFFRAEYKTISEVFGGVYVFSTRGLSYPSDKAQNVIIVATKDKKNIAALTAQAGAAVGDKTAALMGNYWTAPIETGDVAVLTDDYSPVSYYGAAVCVRKGD